MGHAKRIAKGIFHLDIMLLIDIIYYLYSRKGIRRTVEARNQRRQVAQVNLNQNNATAANNACNANANLLQVQQPDRRPSTSSSHQPSLQQR